MRNSRWKAIDGQRQLSDLRRHRSTDPKQLVAAVKPAPKPGKVGRPFGYAFRSGNRSIAATVM